MIYIFDPTAKDALSKVRGVGRYVQVLSEAFSTDAKIVHTIASIPSDATFINPFFDFLKAPLTLKSISKKQIAVIHDIIRLKYPEHFPIGFKGKINLLLNRLCLKQYSYIVTDSEVSKNDICSYFHLSEDTVKVIYPFVSNKFEQVSETTLPNDLEPHKYCLYVGDGTWNKNIVHIIQAIGKLNIPCVFVGNIFSKLDESQLTHPEQRELYAFNQEVKKTKNCVFPGYVSDSELAALYANAVCNILVSRDEGFGFSYLEAAQFKTPSVLAARPIFREIAQDTALFADPENPEDITEKIKEFITDNQKRNKYGEKAYNRSKNFSPEKFKQEFKELLSFN